MSKIRGKKTYEGLKELIESNGKRFCKKFFWGLLSNVTETLIKSTKI